MLTFDEASHTYRIDGKRVPSVTQVLASLTDYSHIDADALERARQEGVAIHKMVELEVTGDLDLDTLPEWMKSRYAAWMRFKADVRLEFLASEKRMGVAGNYAGTLDLVGEAGSKRREVWLIDIKRSLYAGRAIGLQTAAYARLWNGISDRRIRRRFALVLQDNGEYRLTEFKDPHDDAVFLAALTLHRWKSKGA